MHPNIIRAKLYGNKQGTWPQWEVGIMRYTFHESSGYFIGTINKVFWSFAFEEELILRGGGGVQDSMIFGLGWPQYLSSSNNCSTDGSTLLMILMNTGPCSYTSWLRNNRAWLINIVMKSPSLSKFKANLNKTVQKWYRCRICSTKGPGCSNDRQQGTMRTIKGWGRVARGSKRATGGNWKKKQ